MNEKARYPDDQCNAARELTVGEYLDRAIQDAQRRADGLREFKTNLSLGYLGTGCSRLAQTLKL